MSPIQLKLIGAQLLVLFVLLALDDPQTRGWLQARWSTVSRNFAKRRERMRKRRDRIRIDGPPHENCRRDVNTGSWT